jgi:hypothetical protein
MVEAGHTLKVTEYGDLIKLYCSETNHFWDFTFDHDPSVEELVKGQEEHDKQWEALSESDRIVDAVMGYAQRYSVEGPSAETAFRKFVTELFKGKEEQAEATPLIKDGTASAPVPRVRYSTGISGDDRRRIDVFVQKLLNRGLYGVTVDDQGREFSIQIREGSPDHFKCAAGDNLAFKDQHVTINSSHGIYTYDLRPGAYDGTV